MLVSPKELHDKLRAGALVFDARFRLNDPAAGKKLYSEGHIPGALHWGLLKKGVLPLNWGGNLGKCW
jgi:3-mercaptopyruvate sulfurtransferase SseA